MAEPLRHRQTKEAETDMPGLPPPRHIPTLPGSDRMADDPADSGLCHNRTFTTDEVMRAKA
jgi:hypothetical protein